MSIYHQGRFCLWPSTVAMTNVLLMLLVSVSIIFHVEIAYSADKGEKASINLADSGGKSDLSDEYKKLLALARKNRNRHRSSSIDAKIDISKHPVIGKQHATIALIEFGDFQCPFCRRHLQSSMPNIKSEHIDSGNILYVFFDFPSSEKHPHAIKAAEAARCSGDQGKYWEMRAQLYTNHKAINPMFLEGHAKAIQLDILQFNTCLNNGK